MLESLLDNFGKRVSTQKVLFGFLKWLNKIRYLTQGKFYAIYCCDRDIFNFTL